MVSDSSRICVFVRHGESQSNVSHTWSRDLDKYPLTEAGAMAVEEAAAELSRLRKPANLYSSPVLRARQTAEIISKRVRIEPKITPLLIERGFGKYNNTGFRAGEDRKRIMDEQIAANYPDWESWHGMITRMMKFSDMLKPGEVDVAVTHMDPIKALIGHFMGKEEPSMRDVHLKNVSFNVIDFAKNGADAILSMDSNELPEALV